VVATRPRATSASKKRRPAGAELERVEVHGRAEWRRWLSTHHARTDGVWLVTYKKRSAWSAVNKARVERLLAARKIAPPGLAAIEQAKADGSWSRLDEVEALVPPPDLARALARHGSAREHFAAFPRSSKRIILGWIASAKTEATRSKRIEETARLAAENRRANHWRQ